MILAESIPNVIKQTIKLVLLLGNENCMKLAKC